ncbi:MAG TPA: CBS domain-containing protein [bacterium]
MGQHRGFHQRAAGNTSLQPLTVRALMTPSPATLAPHDLVLDAMRLMRERGIRHIPIVNAAGHLKGLVTETDILRTVFHGAMGFREPDAATLDVTLPLEQVMSRDVATLKSGDPVERAVGLFLERKIRSAPILDDAGKVEGIVTDMDLIRLLQHMMG